MRTLTPVEQQMLSGRRDQFCAFLEDRMPVLAHFIECLRLPNPALVVADPNSFVEAVDQWMRGQTVTDSDRTWILTRLGYFIGELLVQRNGGHWFIDEVPDSRFFGRYVVGQFPRAAQSSAMVDPFMIAASYLSERHVCSLKDLVARVESELAGT